MWPSNPTLGGETYILNIPQPHQTAPPAGEEIPKTSLKVEEEKGKSERGRDNEDHYLQMLGDDIPGGPAGEKARAGARTQG